MRQLVSTIVLAAVACANPPAVGDPPGPPDQGRGDSEPFPPLTFTRDLLPGARDSVGHRVGGVEVNHLLAHRGRLYATVSTWKQEGWNTGDTPGPRVLVKASGDAAWQRDHAFGPDYARAEHLQRVVWTTDAEGRALSAPVDMLVATATGASRRVSVWTRDDRVGRWTESPIRSARTVWGSEVRTLVDHVDAVTGIHHLFAFVNEGTIHRGSFDPEAPARIRWAVAPELDHRAMMAQGQRMPSATEHEGVLYASLEMDPARPGIGGLFRRVDGPVPQWEHVYEWVHAAAQEEAAIGHKLDRQIRGLVSAPAAGHPERAVLLAGRGYPVGEILAIDPADGFAAEVELDVEAFADRELGVRGTIVRQIGANEPLPVRHPDDGRVHHLIGLWLSHPRGTGTEEGNSSWYLVRGPEGAYELRRIWTSEDPVPNPSAWGGLRTARTMALSPFPEEGWAVYFGGFDSGLSTTDEAFSGEEAWIYRGVIP